MKTYAGVVRVSHMGDRRAGAENVHTDREQVEQIRATTPKGARLDLLPYELDTSGGLPLEKRPSLLQAVEGVESGHYAGIVVAYQSRLFRNVEEEEAVWRRVEQAGGEVLIALDPVDNTTADGRMVRRIKSSINAAERERHAERFERLREVSTARGIWQRRQTPRGYTRDERRGSDTYRKLIPDGQRKQVESAFREYLRTGNISTVARRLGMTTSGVRAMLRNRVYLGELRVGQHVKRDAHEAIIGPETFAAVQAKLDSNVRPARNGDGPALLAGLVRCASCGHVMSRNQSNGHRTYSCPKRHSGATCPAPAAIMSARLEAYVVPIAQRELARLKVTATEGKAVAAKQRALADAERERDAFVTATQASGVGAEHFAAGLRERAAAVEAAEEALAAELARQPAVPKVGTGAEVWEDLNAHERNDLLRALLTAVDVLPAGRGGRTVPVADRVRVLRYGAAVRLPGKGNGTGTGIVPIPFDDLDGDDVLTFPARQDRS